MRQEWWDVDDVRQHTFLTLATVSSFGAFPPAWVWISSGRVSGSTTCFFLCLCILWRTSTFSGPYLSIA